MFVIGVIAWDVATIHGQDFHIKGQIEEREELENHSVEFEFFVKGVAWQVIVAKKLPDVLFPGARTMPDGKVIDPPNVPGRKPGDKIVEDRTEVFTMGGDTLEEHYIFETQAGYYTESQPLPRPGYPAEPPRPAGHRFAQKLILYPGPVPWDCREKVLPFLWLAYGSRPYFESLKTNMVNPFYHQWAGRWGFAGYQQEGRWKLANTVPRLPLVMTYMNPGLKWIRPVENGVLTTNFIFVPYSAPYNEGFTNGHYQVLATTNVGGLILPTEFQFDEYQPAGGGKIEAFRTVRGKVLSVASYCPRKSLKFEFPGELVVTDERVRIYSDRSRSSGYLSSRWLTTNEARARIEGFVQSMQKTNKVSTVSPAVKPKATHWWQALAVIAALALPGLLVWWRVRARRPGNAGGGK